MKNVVTVSPKYQVVIPRAIRSVMEIRPGQKVRVFQYRDRIELVPVKPLKALRGFLRGMETGVSREGEGC